MITLFCLPCAGGSASMYFPWQAALQDVVQLQAVELPGRGRRIREPLQQDYVVLLDRLTDELAGTAAPSSGYVLFGHSMGGLLAQGLARSLPQRGWPAPRALMVSACAAPLAREWVTPEDSDAALIVAMRRQGGTREEVFDCPELLELALPVLRADYRVCSSFQMQRPADEMADLLNLPVHVYGGIGDPLGSAALQAWQRETRGSVTLDWFDGGHFYLQGQQDALLARLRRHLQAHANSLSHADHAAALAHA
jgi:surfactin synthase thioesterase subunit